MEIFNLEASDIENLELKLKGELPVDRDELLALVNSWGRNGNVYIYNKDYNKIRIEFCETKEKYDLSNLDVSEIINFDSIFAYSNFNEDILKWDVSNATSMTRMFSNSQNFNSPLDKWNVSKVTSMEHMFSYAKAFNQNLNSWDISQIISMNYIFESTKEFNKPILWNLSKIGTCFGMFIFSQSFQNKFNNGENLPIPTTEIENWLKNNRDRMIALNVEDAKAKELDNFLLNLNNGIYNEII